MPIYAYECNGCGTEHEFIQKFSESPKRKCPACGALRLRKQVTAAAFHLKGSGWYVTDFRDGDKKGDKKDGDEKSTSSEAASTDSGKGDDNKGDDKGDDKKSKDAKKESKDSKETKKTTSDSKSSKPSGASA